MTPLSDARAYYDAGSRLNAGLPLYPADADPNAAEFYRYPPLLASPSAPIAWCVAIGQDLVPLTF